MATTMVQYIVTTPGLRGGKPHIDGRRITVSDIAIWHLKQGMPIAQIAGDYDLPIASVYAALAYYFDHREEIDQRMAEDEAFAEEFIKNNPSPLQEKLRKLRGE